jgi:hypothetical protein
VQILAMLPISISRQPENYGDLFFTEIFAETKNDAAFQYLEIYNATLDTLELSQCRIARNAITSATTYHYKILEDLILPPMEFLYLGRDSVANADFYYTGLKLEKNGHSLGFFCGTFVIDTLDFSANSGNSFPIAQGKAMQLPLANFENRTNGSFWCSGFSPKQDAECQ